MSTMNEPEPLIHQQSRLYIMSALAALSADSAYDFVGLKNVTGLTDGNLSVHLSVLEQAGYLEVEKGYNDRKPKTWIRLTLEGRKAFLNYVETLEKILRGSLSDKQVSNQNEFPTYTSSPPPVIKQNPFPATG